MQKKYNLLFVVAFAAAAFIFPTKTQAQTLTDSLRLYMSFNDSTSKDQTGKHPAFDVGSFTAVPGKVGSGFLFNGSNYISVIDIDDITLKNRPNRNFSISLWFFNTNTSANTIRPILGSLIEESKNTDYVIFLENNNLIWGTGSSADTCAWSKIAEPSRNAWHHLVVTYSSANGMSGTKEIYLDNNLVKTCNFSQKAAPDSRLTIGSMMSGATGNREFFDGILDEIRFYNRKLSGTDVAMLYNPTSSVQDDKKLTQNLQVFPNPVKDELSVMLPENASGFTVEIINALGQTVIAENNVSSSPNFKMNVAGLEKGIYLVKVYDNKSVYVSKIIKE